MVSCDGRWLVLAFRRREKKTDYRFKVNILISLLNKRLFKYSDGVSSTTPPGFGCFKPGSLLLPGWFLAGSLLLPGRFLTGSWRLLAGSWGVVGVDGSSWCLQLRARYLTAELRCSLSNGGSCSAARLQLLRGAGAGIPRPGEPTPPPPSPHTHPHPLPHPHPHLALQSSAVWPLCAALGNRSSSKVFVSPTLKGA